MSVVVKAFLERNGDQKAEIRRFGVPSDASASYTYIFKKISEVFPGLVTGNFNLYWKDADGDLISFSSDDELMEALGFVNDAVFRIYVKEHAPSSGSGSNGDNSGNIHPNVVCDSCDGAVSGTRYKCCVCPDYDLCSQCEAKNLHPEHDMWKIVAPMNSCGPGNMPFRPPPHFRRWMRRFMKRWHTGNAGGCGMETEGDGAPGPDSDPNTEETNKQEETTPEDEYLNGVGADVAAMLDPFGIDVSYEVEHNDRRRGGGCHGRRGCRGFGGRGFWGWGGPHGPHGHRGHGPHGHGPHGHGPHGPGFGHCPRRRGQCPRQGKKGDEEMKEATDNGRDTTSMEKDQDVPKTSSSQSEAPVTDQMKGLHINDGSNGEGDTEWTVLSDSRSPPASQSGHADPKIADALTQMLQMGFTDDGGWLTRLLEAKKGDISQVLDAIKPDRRTNGGYKA